MISVEELIAKSQAGDKTAEETLVVENSGLIWSVVKRFIGRGTDADDLYQLGCLGFLKAVEGFDMQFGTKFSTYAVPKIAGEIRRFLRDDGTIKISRSIKEQAAVIKAARNKMANLLGREPGVQELSDETGFSPEEIAVAETATASAESIYQELGDDGFSLEHVLSDTDSEEEMLEKISLKHAVNKLPEREATVIRLRYFHGLTQSRVASVLDISQVQVSRVEKKALGLLREYLR